MLAQRYVCCADLAGDGACGVGGDDDGGGGFSCLGGVCGSVTGSNCDDRA